MTWEDGLNFAGPVRYEKAEDRLRDSHACAQLESVRETLSAARQGWRTENDHIAELTRSDGELQWKRHSLAVCIPESR